MLVMRLRPPVWLLCVTFCYERQGEQSSCCVDVPSIRGRCLSRRRCSVNSPLYYSLFVSRSPGHCATATRTRIFAGSCFDVPPIHITTGVLRSAPVHPIVLFTAGGQLMFFWSLSFFVFFNSPITVIDDHPGLLNYRAMTFNFSHNCVRYVEP